MAKAFNLSRCEKTNMIISGKVKGIQIEGCNNCAVVVDDVVSAIEIMNCTKVQV
jgi:Adenylate cyclase associated (CAP) C terminal